MSVQNWGGSPWGKGGGGPQWGSGGGGGFGGMPWMGGGGGGGEDFQEWLKMMNAWDEFYTGYGQEEVPGDESLPVPDPPGETPPPGSGVLPPNMPSGELPPGNPFAPPIGSEIDMSRYGGGALPPGGLPTNDQSSGGGPPGGDSLLNNDGGPPGGVDTGLGPLDTMNQGTMDPRLRDLARRNNGMPPGGGPDISVGSETFPGGPDGSRYGRPQQPYQGFRPKGRLAGGLGRMGGNKSSVTPKITGSGNTPWG